MTDTDALNRRMAEALDPHSEIIAVHEGYGAEVVVHSHQSAVIAAVLPVVAAEVRKAKAEAWDECAEMAAHHGAFDGSRTRWLSSINPYRETGDQR